MTEGEIVARLDAGVTVVVRLPGLYRPYQPLLRRLAAERRLVRIGRGTPWGNPYRLAPGADEGIRRQVIDKYGRWLDQQPELLAALPSLAGKALACYCWPLACHGDLLAERVNGLTARRP